MLIRRRVSSPRKRGPNCPPAPRSAGSRVKPGMTPGGGCRDRALMHDHEDRAKRHAPICNSPTPPIPSTHFSRTYLRPLWRVYSPPIVHRTSRGTPTKRRVDEAGGEMVASPRVQPSGRGAAVPERWGTKVSCRAGPTPLPPSRPTVPKIPSRRVALGVSSTPNTVRRRPAHSARGRPLAHGEPNPEAARPSEISSCLDARERGA